MYSANDWPALLASAWQDHDFEVDQQIAIAIDLAFESWFAFGRDILNLKERWDVETVFEHVIGGYWDCDYMPDDEPSLHDMTIADNNYPVEHGYTLSVAWLAFDAACSRYYHAQETPRDLAYDYVRDTLSEIEDRFDGDHRPNAISQQVDAMRQLAMDMDRIARECYDDVETWSEAAEELAVWYVRVGDRLSDMMGR